MVLENSHVYSTQQVTIYSSVMAQFLTEICITSPCPFTFLLSNHIAHLTAAFGKFLVTIRANAIHRCFILRNVELLVRAYLVYVRPLLEYNSPAWSPYLMYDIQATEYVQRRFTKRLPGFGIYSYGERLQLLQLSSLELRRLRIDLSLVL